jgi:hypothetical protein
MNLSAQQKNTSTKGGFISIGFGGQPSQGFFDEIKSLAGTLSSSYYNRDNVYTLEYLIGGILKKDYDESFRQLSIKYSKRIGERFVKYYIGGGVCITSVKYEDSNEYPQKKQFLGIPVEAGISIIPIKIMAINLNISYTIRHRTPGIIMLAGISVGALR